MEGEKKENTKPKSYPRIPAAARTGGSNRNHNRDHTHTKVRSTLKQREELSRRRLFKAIPVLSLSYPPKNTLTSYPNNFLSLSLSLPLMSNCTVERCTVETSDGVKLSTKLFKPREEEEIKKGSPVVVLVHPYSVLGGCQGLLRGIAAGLADRGYKALTFDMRGVGRSTGRASLTGFAEIKDVVAVCKWVSENQSADRILLLGSSAGAPIAGSAVDQVEQVVGYVGLGYPFGMLASILFGRHHKAILQSSKPKLFVLGTEDGFTSVKQLKNKLSSAAGRVETHLIEGASHFQMEGPAYDAQMVNLILEFIASL